MAGSTGRILIGGGTGFVGSHLCNLLKLKGYEVTAVSRMPGPQRLSWQDVQDRGIPDGTTAVVNLAGQNVMDVTQRWSEGFKQNIRNSRVNTTKALAQAITAAPTKPKVFVTISGVGIYPPCPDTEYTEQSRVKEYDFLSSVCHEWEKAAKLPPDLNVRQVTVRSGVVLGRHGGMIKQLYLPFYLGLGGPVLPGDQYLPWIHIGDLTRLILFAIENCNVKGILNGVAPQTITNKVFSNAFARALWRPAVIPVPQFALEFLLNKERAKMLTEGQKVLPKRTISVGFKYAFPDIDSACAEIILSPPTNAPF